MRWGQARQVARFMVDVPFEPVMKVVVGRTEVKVKEAAEHLGWEEYATRWENVIARKDIDIVDICTPGDSHMPIAAAVEVNGLLKTFITERPLPDNPAKKGPVDVDDAALSLVRYDNGALGNICERPANWH